MFFLLLFFTDRLGHLRTGTFGLLPLSKARCYSYATPPTAQFPPFVRFLGKLVRTLLCNCQIFIYEHSVAYKLLFTFGDGWGSITDSITVR